MTEQQNPGSARPSVSESRTAGEAHASGITLELIVNDRRRVVSGVPSGASLLVALREHLGLPGAKNACEQGECGSCTVYLDDMPVCACLVAAGQAVGARVRTVEGLATRGERGPEPSALQSAFLECGAVQCGFCTPGILVALDEVINRPRGRTIINLEDAELREALAGNLCRCTGYEKVLEAVRTASSTLVSEARPVVGASE